MEKYLVYLGLHRYIFTPISVAYWENLEKERAHCISTRRGSQQKDNVTSWQCFFCLSTRSRGIWVHWADKMWNVTCNSMPNNHFWTHTWKQKLFSMSHGSFLMFSKFSSFQVFTFSSFQVPSACLTFRHFYNF